MQFSLSTSIFLVLLAATNIAAAPIDTHPPTQTVDPRELSGPAIIMRGAGATCIPFAESQKKGVCNAKGQCEDPNDVSGAGPFGNGEIFAECL